VAAAARHPGRDPAVPRRTPRRHPGPTWPCPPSPALGDPDGGTTRRPGGLLDLTISWAALTGSLSAPAALGRLGPVSTAQALPLAVLAVADPAAQWRVILTGPAGQAIAVERVRRGRLGDNPGRPPGVTGRVTVTIPAATLTTAGATSGTSWTGTGRGIRPPCCAPPAAPPPAPPKPPPPTRPPTGPPPGSASTSRPATRPAASPAAASRPGAPTWTTPDPGTKAAPPAPATSAAAAGPIIRSSSSPAGPLPSTAPAPSPGPPPPDAATPPPPTPTPANAAADQPLGRSAAKSVWPCARHRRSGTPFSGA